MNARRRRRRRSRLVARLELPPLLALGRADRDSADITLADPRIVVTVDSQGRSNWSPLLTSLDPRVRYQGSPRG